MSVTKAKATSRTIPQAVQGLCLAFPGAEEKSVPPHRDYRVAGKTFAWFVINHHGDGRVALWLPMPKGAQLTFTELAPHAYFVPPYVGHKGWLGIELDQGLGWKEIAARVREAWENVAPASLVSQLDATPKVEPPTVGMTPEEIDPLLGKRPAALLAEFDAHCRRFPEVTKDNQFGRPVWKAGKKTFAGAFHTGGRLGLDFWVGVEQQAMMTMDPRFTIPKYTGHNGWINLDVEDGLDWDEIDALLEGSYRHFALKRMLKALEP